MADLGSKQGARDDEQEDRRFCDSSRENRCYIEKCPSITDEKRQAVAADVLKSKSKGTGLEDEFGLRKGFLNKESFPSSRLVNVGYG
mmetsp:Transcript_15731/g.25878  ORF Transcript_15731/g.25878 Transcript_15731/m.25878 type:complete len:87 (-) Transcript_15731:620-880(-)